MSSRKESNDNSQSGGAVIGLKKGLLLFIFLYLFFVVIRLPAARVWPTVLKKAGLTAQQIQLSDAEGSWLAGSFARVRVSGLELGKVSWHFRPLSILLGSLRLDLDLKMAEAQVSGVVKAGPRTISFNRIQGGVPLHLISKIGGLPGIELSGMLNLAELSFSFKNGQLSTGSGEVTWQEAGITKPYKLQAGNLAAVFITDSEGIRINASDKGGAVMVRAAGLVMPDGNYSINGEFAARDTASPDLVSFLKILGEPGPDGRVSLSYRGKVENIFR